MAWTLAIDGLDIQRLSTQKATISVWMGLSRADRSEKQVCDLGNFICWSGSAFSLCASISVRFTIATHTTEK